MRLIVIRHTKVAVESGICYGQSDVAVADSFEEEKKQVLNRVQNVRFDKIYSSPLTRCKLLAEGLFKKEQIIFDDRLKELNFGDWELKRFAEAEAMDPARIRAFWETPGDSTPPNGESWNQVCARVDAAVDRVMAAHTDRDLIVVAHFGAILTQIARAENLDGSAAFSHKIDNLSVTTLLTQPTWSAQQINHNP